jgi:glutathione peroxidase
MLSLVLSIALAAAPEPSPMYAIKAKTIDGKEKSLAEYKGKAVLIVNTASECGATPQLGPLQELSDKYKDRGLVVLGFPSNDFGEQEPGSNAEIKKFCALNYKTKFELFAKTPVKGEKAHPLFKFLASSGEPTWNFNKYLVDPAGKVVAHFETDVEPLSEELVKQIEAVLPKKQG